MCPVLGKDKARNVRVWSEEKFTDQEGADWEDRRRNGTSDPSCLLDWAKGFYGAGGGFKGLVEHVLTERPWNLW